MASEVGKIGDYAIRITNVYTSQGDEFDEPSQGYQYVIVEVEIKNEGSKTLSYNSLNFNMKNSSGEVTSEALTIVNVDTALSAGELTGGESVTGTIAFEQPINDNNLQLIYEEDIFFEGDSIIFSLRDYEMTDLGSTDGDTASNDKPSQEKPAQPDSQNPTEEPADNTNDQKIDLTPEEAIKLVEKQFPGYTCTYYPDFDYINNEDRVHIYYIGVVPGTSPAFDIYVDRFSGELYINVGFEGELILEPLQP